MNSNFQLELRSIYCDKTILVTGHTGFKGSWLCEWLLSLGARVVGVSLPPPTTPSHFEQLGLEKRMDHRILDIRDPEVVSRVINEVQPDAVFHLAAQSLVRLSYAIPVDTYATNVMGSIHVMEGLRKMQERQHKRCAAVMITTDKCYENQEWVHSYREADPMGGYDPYSSSKGMAELAISAYRRSYFSTPQSCIQIASARAGNVIGGGDWALDRIVPDCIRSLQKGEPVPVRNKVATRPWQHVLEPLSGYLLLGAKLMSPDAQKYCTCFNFGPSLGSNRTVADLVGEILKHWSGEWVDKSDPLALHEASLLNLSTDKAHHLLDWQPRWDFQETIARTVQWYHNTLHGQRSPLEQTRADLKKYEN